ncbi:hypothetical protein BLA60_12385 [Actinophytocola xinjiangensis]|uniref:Amino acid adenylation domain-containing protein n=1 Tax=Actinophytocola xinjiangensis TaxID=485602 RepID=A0A7Z0WS27_9PSEU|nr:hybrid non-ribosomal peptide synthetase/type I polyketide synthase [Actinophytocola xinjiangensis]OLF11713.1 hypothetical protein BLA60_12385 [Actinophytocola xinjiangensis]
MNSTDIAITGMAIRCPGVTGLDEFWANLAAGVESVSRFAPDELEDAAFLSVDRTHPRFVPAGGELPDADRFDAAFFGMSPAEAELTDPQHRLFLECAWTAMEDSGRDLTSHDGAVAVYAGCGSNTYALSVLSGATSPMRAYQGLIGNEKDHLATRVAYKLNLSGEAISVQTACSTSLVAVHLACQSLLSGQSDIAIAGGVSVRAAQRTGYVYREDAIFSPDGHCRAFDARAEGTVFGSGLGAVVLRPLADALADGDRVYAVIKGSMINNDAGAKVGYTAPSVDAQAAVVAGALEFSGVRADDIGYVEAHGTGTRLGDPVEIAALAQAFRLTTDRTGYCPIGSVKTNVGHLDAAAGVTGLIKTALSLWHRKIPASLHCGEPNPAIDFGPFFVNTELRDWTAPDGRTRFAGVSSFGIGGTNAHMVLGEAPALAEHTAARPEVVVLTLSAKDDGGLRRLAARHAERLTDAVPLADYCATANTGRARLPHRLAVVGRTAADLREALAGQAITGEATGTRSVAFQFAGQGVWYPGLAEALYERAARFAEVIDECSALLGRSVLDPSADLSRTDVAQPVLFAVQYALARLVRSWGVRPDAVVGHSFGEYAAACLAGVFSLADGMRLVTERGRLMQRTDGLMAAVFAAEGEVDRALEPYRDRVSIAAVNGPAHTVISGDRAAVTDLIRRFDDRGVRVRELAGGFPFHSPLVDSVAREFQSTVDTVAFDRPRLPFVSGRTGEVATDLGCDYWAAQLREPVRYADSVATLVGRGVDVVVELGAHPVLSQLGTRAVADPAVLWVPTLAEGVDDQEALLTAAARLHVVGVSVDWAAVHGPPRRVADLPAYPFAGERHWLDTPHTPTPPAAPEAAPTSAEPATSAVRLREITAGLLRISPDSVDLDAPLLQVGLDSLALIEAAQVIEEELGVRLTVRQLLTDLTTLADVAAYVDRRRSAPAARPAPPAPAAAPRAEEDTAASKAFVPHRPITVVAEAAGPALREFVAAYTRRTAESKRLAGLHRPVLADNDNRVVSDFRMAIKEMVYPIAATSSKGARVVDVDGNEYVDVMMGYGSNLFGHSPDFVTDAVRAQLDRGVHIGVQSDLAGRVAALLAELTGLPRVAFCNSGSEAVMMALRLARTATMRTKVAMFAGSYHGIYDGTLGARRRLRADSAPTPVAPGIPQHMVDDLLVLDYDDPASLAALRAHGPELAAILVEPVQSRRPDVRPAAFLRELRAIADDTGAALVFDEIVTGLRTAPGGAQEWFGVRADLATYGKVLGGGLPIGAVAGRAGFLDTIDGGVWAYGDDSAPTTETTFFAGTFCKHPLAMSAALAVLTELKRAGAGFQESVNRRVDTLAERLNVLFAAEGVPITVAHFGSLFRFASTQDIHLLFYQLVHRGIHIREGHNAFLSAAHTDDDVDTIVRAVRDSVDALRELGALPGGPPRFAPTVAQRQLWTLARLTPEASAAYHQSAVLRLTGKLDVAALRRAVNRVVARHEALRTVFDLEDGWQRVLPEVVVDVPEVDGEDGITGLSREPFDLATGPLLRCAVARTGPENALFGFTAHHIAADGWSMGVLMAEIGTCYSAESGGQAPVLPEPTPFRDFARRTHRDEALAYWTDRMSGPLPTLDLPADRPRPAVARYQGARHTVELDRDLVDRLRTLGTGTGSTLFTVLLSAYSLLLHHLTGDDDVIVGVPTAGRLWRGSERIVGHCTNLLAARTLIDGAERAADLVRRVQADLLGAFEHQDLPFGVLVDHLGIRTDPGRTPLVATTFNLDRAVSPPALSDLAVELVATPVDHVQFDLVLNAVDADGGLRLDIDYRTDLFDAATISRWAGHYATLLSGMADRPESTVAALPVLSERERHDLSRWNDTAAVHPLPGLFDLFAEQVERTPGATCLWQGAESVTYAELAERADQAARHLRAHRIGQEDVVAVPADRSIRQIAAILGVLKVGAAYAPGATDARFRIDEWPERDGEPVTPARTDPDALAHVLRTSGSTGEPKAVGGTHGAVVNRLRWGWDAQPFAPGEVGCLKTAATFVDSVAELFGPLLRGVPVVIATDDVHDPVLFLRTLADHGVTRIVVVPSLLSVLLDTMESTGRRLPALRLWTVSGEPLPADLARRFQTLLPAATLVNIYGCTEVMADATWHDRADGGTTVPIGLPLTNTRAHVLGRHLTPTPVGVPAEVYIAGDGLARGYLGAPGRTAERFVPDPSGEPGTRMYRTGDLARRRQDGTLEHLGRTDRQVKVRGIRVEPGEVETALRGLAGVHAAAVVAKPGPGGYTRLVAHVVSDDVDVRAALTGQLPAHLVPSEVVEHERLPLTSSGKIDRRTLESHQVATDRAQPRTVTERVLRTVWSEVLDRRAPDVHTSFFDLGGDSLSMMRLVPRIHREFAAELGVAELFADPTIAGMAVAIEAGPASAAGAAIPRHPDNSGPLSFGQQRIWFTHQYAPDTPVLNEHVLLRLTGALDRDALSAALDAARAAHDVLRTRFVTEDGQPWQVVDAQAPAAIPLVKADEAAALLLARQEVGRPFTLETGPLLRSTLYRTGEREHLFVLVAHHIVVDGWSLGVLAREVVERYRGRTPPQPAVRYLDFAAWQRAGGQAVARDLEYWADHLTGMPGALNLPADRPRPAERSVSGGVREFSLPPETMAAVSALTRQTGCTPYMVLLAALQTLLSRYSGQADFGIGSPIANRTRPELEGLIGYVANTVVLRADLAGDPTFRDLLGRVRATTLRAYEHQALPFEQVVEHLRPERDTGRTPLFQVMFILQNAPAAELAASGLTVTDVPLHNGTAKHDLTVELTPTPEGGCAGRVEYSSDLFDADRVDRLTGHLAVLLDGVLADPDRPVTDVDVLTPGERDQLEAWRRNDTVSPEALVHRLVEERAARHPTRVAARHDDRELTYGELNSRANRVARHLRERGAELGDLVGVRAERGIDYLTVLLAILKAGAVYLPVDPGLPAARAERVVRDSGCALTLTDLGELVAVAGDDTDLADGPGLGDLAYVLYTSGSTGMPKGVMVEHRGMTNHVLAKLGDLGITEADVVAQNGPQSFDVSVWQFLAPLVVGGRVEIFTDEVATDPSRLIAEVAERGVTVLQVVPAVLRGLVDVPDRPDLPRLRWLVPTGDALMVTLARAWFAHHPHVPLLNTYGSTECSDDQCHIAFDGQDALVGSPPVVSIGRPIPGTSAHVLDGRLRPLPVGLPGELFIGGVGVGRGYLGDPRRTAQVFLPDPFSATPGARLYRTRDQVRLLADGTLEFLGRTDSLVKVRGFRIELGEIESALLDHPTVRDAAVVARADGDGQKRLAAYVVADPPHDDLRAFLRQRLPEYMVPASITALDAFPLNGNGKVDRARLPVPEMTARTAEHVAPRTRVETAVAEIFGEVLGVDRVGAHDRFFDLGGHSLLATRVLARLRQSFDVEVPMRFVFAADSVAELAAEVERRAADLTDLITEVELLSDEDVDRLLRERGLS